MKKLFFTFFIILLAVGLGFLMHRDSGYVLFAYNGWVLETSFWAAIIAGILLFLLVYFLLRFISHLANLDVRWQNWRMKRRHHKMHEKNEAAVYEAIVGNFSQAEKHFSKAAKMNGSQAIAYLGAAFCANQEKAFDRRDEYLQAAQQADPDATTIIQTAKVGMLVESESWVQAKVLLQELLLASPKNHLLLLWYHQSCAALGDFHELAKFSPIFLKENIVDEAQAREYCLQSFKQDLSRAQAETAVDAWSALSRKYRKDPEFKKLYEAKRF